MKRAALALCMLIALAAPAKAATARATVDDLIALAEGGLSNETILVFVQNRPVEFAGTAEEILRLREAGVSEEVIRALLEGPASEDGYVAAAPAVRYYTSSAYDTYPSRFYYPRSYYSSLYLGTLLYPSFYYSHRYHGSNIVFRHGRLRHRHLRTHGLHGRRHGGSFFIGGGHGGFAVHAGKRSRRHRHLHRDDARLRRGHGFGFSTGHHAKHPRGHRGLHLGAHLGTGHIGVRHGAGFRGHRGGHFGGVRGGFHGGGRAGFGGGSRGGHAGHR